MFKKILIANRGEIACRIIDTATRLGVETVAVYSKADDLARHVSLADQAVFIGPAPVAESYLCGDTIIDAALKTGAEAIHPGYGFLSENPDFVEAVEAAGLVFIGPTANAIRAMGLKDAAKALMEKAGVPVVPGYHGDDQNPALLAQHADSIGYPVLIKARAGGGGKGMRLVENAADFPAALESAAREGQNAFGDPAVLIEKYITSPRHIEVQVFGDSHGNVVHFFERDCSLQRRHQKVIEEAPAPDMPEDVRQAMTSAAVTAAKAIGYENAGTVEFIVDSSGPLRVDGFWFMEMNTRLQVEHPVTEAITGFDLVELQLRVAAGDVLPVTQSDIHISGHAFEARLYAEDVPSGFLPAVGKIEYLEFPTFARIDTGVANGAQISTYYDPMIAKIITHGKTRSAALQRLEKALSQTHVAGLITNRDFLIALSQHNGFANSKVDTGLIERDLEDLVERPEPSLLDQLLAAILLADLPLSDQYANWRMWGSAQKRVVLDSADEIRLQISRCQTVTLLDKDDARLLELSSISIRDDSIAFECENVTDTARFHLWRSGGKQNLSLLRNGIAHYFSLAEPLERQVDTGVSDDAVRAPMSGTVLVIDVATGDKVSKGDRVCVVEAMKMEMAVTSPRDGEIEEIHVQVADNIEDGAVMVRLKDA